VVERLRRIQATTGTRRASALTSRAGTRDVSFATMMVGLRT
jgi:hypothetical protein